MNELVGQSVSQSVSLSLSLGCISDSFYFDVGTTDELLGKIFKCYEAHSTNSFKKGCVFCGQRTLMSWNFKNSVPCSYICV
jgi:hypothetical protein